MANRSSNQRTTQNPRNTRRVICSAISALIVVGVVSVGARHSDRDRTEALPRRAADRLQALQREADALASTERTLLGDLRKLELEREIKAGELKQADAEVAKVQAEIDAAAVRSAALESAAA